MTDKPREVTFHYVAGPDFRIHPATGVWGGLAGAGLLRMLFFLEVGRQVPESDRLTVDASGKVLSTNSFPPDREGERVFVTGVVIPARELGSLVDWLTARLEEFKRVDAQK